MPWAIACQCKFACKERLVVTVRALADVPDADLRALSELLRPVRQAAGDF